jgi:hypothetical protein
VITKDGRKTSCNFYAPTKLTINELSDSNYLILLRRESIRELLLVPRPDKNKDNYNHYSNEMLIVQEDFWTVLLQKRELLKFHSISLNFGMWETGVSQNKYKQECHSHVHLYFTKDVWLEGVKNQRNSIKT